ncbi:DJ-1/PfpI family protein [Aestuariibius sp. 2305UL40-4]|uniref:DJ-1/PfpI family protein n=1 Tax=Aestuariibius violaceus TaxID=3234132 RepID=UPI00345E3A8E
MQIAIVLYRGFTALDVLGPYEFLKYLPNAEIRFVSHEVGPVATDRGVLVVGATHTYAETPRPDFVMIPGSEAKTAVAAADKRLTEWLRGVECHASYITSVCSGAIVLGAAGLLRGLPATTHWAAMDALKVFGADVRPEERVVNAGKIWTAAGVTAGMDLALAVIGTVAGDNTAQKIQLMIEYDPQPPYDMGHMAKASPDVEHDARKEIARLSRNPSTVIAVAKLGWQKILRKARATASR